MGRLAFWTRCRETVRPYRSQLRFSVRMTGAGLLALIVAQSLALPLHGLWVVLTAVVVTQMSVGESLGATVEYMIGTLALTIAPLAFAAAINPNFRVAPFSAVLVLLLAGQIGEGPIESAFTRFLEVALGGAIALAVSLLVFSQRAHSLGLEAAGQILQRMAEVVPKLLAGFTQSSNPHEMLLIQNELGRAVIGFQDLAMEAKRERAVAFVPEPDPAPLSRTLLRLRHDFVMIGRAARPFPDAIAQRLMPLLAQIGRDVSEFLHANAAALVGRRHPASLELAEVSLNAYDAEVNSLRRKG